VLFDKQNYYGAFDEAIQVCYELNPENPERELNGITEALEFFNKEEGTLVTVSKKGEKLSI
jgi:hypothetical protein